MDGHGLLGEVSAKRVGRSLGAFLEERLQSSSITAMSPAELRGMFHEGFQQAHESSLELYNDPPEVYTYPRVRLFMHLVYLTRIEVLGPVWLRLAILLGAPPDSPPDFPLGRQGGRHSTRYRLKSSQGTPCYTNQQVTADTTSAPHSEGAIPDPQFPAVGPVGPVPLARRPCTAITNCVLDQ